MNNKTVRGARRGVLLVCCLAASFAAMGASLKSLTVCADPGNMPLSNQKGDGFENKIAQVIGAALGTGVQYYWRPPTPKEPRSCLPCTALPSCWSIGATRASISRVWTIRC